ncbi:hypothetical protein BD413DRAFT_609741 [Trametes elegans]|nr:hypothetical protein BD413DRAFT_609741 [Trametes elegans]
MGNSSSPKTPKSAKKHNLADPDKTPTSTPARGGSMHSIRFVRRTPTDTSPAPHTPPRRRNSFEEDMQVNRLPDPRTPEHIGYIDIWQGALLEPSLNESQEFKKALRANLVSRPGEYERFVALLQRKGSDPNVSLDTIIEAAVELFGWDRDLVESFNRVLPPGYRLETHRSYVAVFVPRAGRGWNQYADGRRTFHAEIPSSSR